MGGGGVVVFYHDGYHFQDCMTEMLDLWKDGPILVKQDSFETEGWFWGVGWGFSGALGGTEVCGWGMGGCVGGGGAFFQSVL